MTGAGRTVRSRRVAEAFVSFRYCLSRSQHMGPKIRVLSQPRARVVSYAPCEPHVVDLKSTFLHDNNPVKKAFSQRSFTLPSYANVNKKKIYTQMLDPLVAKARMEGRYLSLKFALTNRHSAGEEKCTVLASCLFTRKAVKSGHFSPRTPH